MSTIWDLSLIFYLFLQTGSNTRLVRYSDGWPCLGWSTFQLVKLSHSRSGLNSPDFECFYQTKWMQFYQNMKSGIFHPHFEWSTIQNLNFKTSGIWIVSVLTRITTPKTKENGSWCLSNVDPRYLIVTQKWGNAMTIDI